jgi:hypothetical protein
MNLYEYFHLKQPESTLELQAATPNTPPLDKRLSKRTSSWVWMKSMFGGEYNPDTLTYNDYDKMLRDPQINFANQLVRLALLSKKLIITPATDDPQDVEIADFIRSVWYDDLETPLRQIRQDQDTARAYGYAIGESIYKIRDDGKITLRDVAPLEISTIQDCFDYENQTIWQNVTGQDPIQIPMNKCMINTFDETFRNKYGRSQLKPLYDTSFMKSYALKWLAIFLEKHEGPTIVGIAGTDSDMTEMQLNIDSIAEGTAGFTGREGEQYQVLESQHRGESFNTAIQYYDHMISISFMIGSLVVGQASSQGGSLAQSQTHLDVFSMAMDGILEDHSIPFQEETKRLTDYNYSTDKYPRCHFEPFTKKDLLGLLQALQPYAQSFVLTVPELGLDQLIPEILSQYAEIDLNTTTEDNYTQPQTPDQTPEILPENNQPTTPEINMKAARPAANYIEMARLRSKRGGQLY